MPELALARAIEVAARAYYEWATLNVDTSHPDAGTEDSRWDDDSPSGEQARNFARERARVMFDAALDRGEIALPGPDAIGAAWRLTLTLNDQLVKQVEALEAELEREREERSDVERRFLEALSALLDFGQCLNEGAGRGEVDRAGAAAVNAIGRAVQR